MGRPKGALNKATTEIKSFARKLLRDKDYRESLKRRLKAGEAPHMETLLHHYAYGKPKDTQEIHGIGGGSVVVKHIYATELDPARD